MTDDRRQELFDALLELVATHGYDRVTMDQIAESAHVSKATLYRQWDGKEAFFVDALLHGAQRVHPDIDTGSLRGDLHEMGRRQADAAADGVAAIPAVLQAIRSSTTLAEAFRERVVTTMLDDLRTVVDRAVARGELATCPPVEHLALAVYAPLTLHHLMTGRTPSADDIAAYLDALVIPALEAR